MTRSTRTTTRRPTSRKGGSSAAPKRAKARARANIALAKYWGKCDQERNLPAVPSISMTLDRLLTDTEVRFDPDLAEDVVVLDGRDATAPEAERVRELLDRVRQAATLGWPARVETRNRFPTAAGLASSASGFAALAAAAAEAAGLRYGGPALSRLARRSSASAARSIFGGFAELPAGTPGDDRLAARALVPAEHWDVALVVAVTAQGEKAVGSTEGMERSRVTSPLYDAWVDSASTIARRIRRALRRRDLDGLGAAMEQSTFSFHAAAMTSQPPIFYWQPATLAALETVRTLRASRGISVWATMDAGPHVKALCPARDAAKVRRALGRTDGVRHTLLARPGPGVEIVDSTRGRRRR